ncbi:Tyrosine-Protein Kinase Mer, partial [Manis pentadactyla]
MFVPMDGNPGDPPVGTKPAGALDHGAEDGLREELAQFENTPEDSPQPKARVWWSQATGRHQDSFMPLLRMMRPFLILYLSKYPDTHSHLPSSEFENTPEDSLSLRHAWWSCKPQGTLRDSFWRRCSG